MLNAELEGNQELANSRMAELEKLQQELQQAVRGHERLKVMGGHMGGDGAPLRPLRLRKGPLGGS